MADVTVLRCWPACVDAIDWSPDGIIALASDERVELLFPNTVDFERDQVLPQWQHVPLKVPLFSTDELPLKEPAPTSNYSIGEEISNSAPISIAWSPPGISKHRKCALAALTANLTLSLWSAEGKPQDETSWGRRLIINDALVDHFGDWDDEPSHVVDDSKERLRSRGRIRAFAWAPALPCPGPDGVVGTHLVYGPHMLVVSDDDNHLVFLKVESPTSSLGAEPDWRADVLTHESFALSSETIFPQPNVFEDMIQQQRYISHIAWSPWIMREGCYYSVLVYATNEDVRAQTITYNTGRIDLQQEVVYADYEMRYDGPMKWFHRVEDGDRLKLALFTNTGLVYLTISALDASIIERSTHDLDGRWDPVSGLVWDTTGATTPRLHISSLLSTLHSPTAILEQTPDGLKSLDVPEWRERIGNNLALFSVKNGLKGNSRAKVWGLTRSPLGDFIAACNSVHPSDMIEYGIPADRSGAVAISSLRPGSRSRDIFPKENVTAEGIMYSLKKLAEEVIEDTDDMPALADEMVGKLVEAYTAPLVCEMSATTSVAYSDVNDLDSLIKEFKSNAFLESPTLKDRYTILVSEAYKTQINKELPKTLIAYRLAVTLQQLPLSLSHTTFSAEIRAHHKQLVTLINMVMRYGDTSESLPADKSSEHQSASRVGTATNGSSITANQTPAVPIADTCDFCSASIPFADPRSATCTNGHVFPRCGLSFLAIQAPGITKYCGICSTPFLSDEFVTAQEYTDSNKSVDAGDNTAMTAVIRGDEVSEGREESSDPLNEVDEEGFSDQEGREQAMVVDQESDDSDDEDDLYEQKELPVTLARVLFLACDVCIYCGGKFIG
ncbi:transcription factor IIIC subunit delta N-term-domain-containing protein [Alternaria rosae]|uniref:transcription factor IIIC subunit delta N-term-domain-containing protein n=1 Tax=Alternaria rosae TaxID=1187941 RepID=UPI001E8D0ABB|nr:transcription factor IIIC subunit delta N-term-domain-containing protein [Alternaria rosae]KAH6864744.1 transcription factor IIIC subunit delta N-term-domain-containing protein [Alternaria rosae]